MQIICMYAANSHALLSFKFNYSNTSIRSLLYNIVQTNRPAHFCRIVLNTFSYFNKSEVVMIYERRGERSFVFGALDFNCNINCVCYIWFNLHLKFASCPFWHTPPVRNIMRSWLKCQINMKLIFFVHNKLSQHQHLLLLESYDVSS